MSGSTNCHEPTRMNSVPDSCRFVQIYGFFPPCLRASVVILLLLTGLARAEAPATQPATLPTSYKLEKFERSTPKLQGWVARIDLTDPKLQIAVGTGGPDPDGAGMWETILAPTSTIAKANNFDLAINTVFFMNKKPDDKEGGLKYQSGDFAASCGLVMTGGKMLALRRDGVPILFDKQNRASIGSLNVIPQGANVIVSGNQQIVFRGQPVAKLDTAERHPRTAIGIADQGKTLVLLVIDGRREAWSVGMSSQELAVAMIELGCQSALNLDGGGSSTMVVRKPTPQGDAWKVINTPSDGSTFPLPLSIERSVPYVLGFRWVANETSATQPVP